MEGIKYFLELLELDLAWPVVLLLLVLARACFPFELKGKVVKTKDKKENDVYKIYKFF